ncbi:MAG: hypothetical protein A2020_01940 [Lentisphaerae bacterium GWF2_45_14]|nr:MAG: hypothetical protein A2020_01940 [Lentisphaerae bacterium GWF2_45_14]
MAEIKPKILGAGSPILDILMNVSEDFVSSIPGSKGGMQLVGPDELDSLVASSNAESIRVPGGSAGNTIFGLAKLGMDVSFFGKVGEDEDGAFYKKCLSEAGGDVKNFRNAGSVHTGRCLSLITPDSERTMRTDLGAAATLTEEDVDAIDFSGITHVHIEGYMLFAEKLLMRLLERSKKAGCTVSLDLASFEVVKAGRAVLPQMLSDYVDIVFSNEDEAREFCGDLAPEHAAEKLSNHCRTAVVKLGRDGCCIRHDAKTVKVPAELVKAVDTTGAGDLWQAGFLYSFLNGKSLEECGRSGSILGAEVVQVIGAKIPDSRWEIIKKRIVS